MLLTDHILHAPIINVTVYMLERELQRRRFFQQTPINDVITMINASTGVMLEVTDCEVDKQELRDRRRARLPLVECLPTRAPNPKLESPQS
jgi:hypothetical protein